MGGVPKLALSIGKSSSDARCKPSRLLGRYNAAEAGGGKEVQGQRGESKGGRGKTRRGARSFGDNHLEHIVFAIDVQKNAVTRSALVQYV